MENRCVEIQGLLSAFLDGELGEKERRAVETHIESCETCARILAELRAGDELLRRSVEAEPIEPERERAALERVVATLADQPRQPWETDVVATRGRSQGWRWRFGWLSGLAAATAAVLLALRLGPFPLAPERPKSIPARSEATLAEPSADAPGLEPSPRSEDRSTEVQEIEKKIVEAADEESPPGKPQIAESEEQPTSPPPGAGGRSEPVVANRAPVVDQKIEEPEPTEAIVERRLVQDKAIVAVEEGFTRGMPTDQADRTRMMAKSRFDEDRVAATLGPEDRSDTLRGSGGWRTRLVAEERALRATPEADLTLQDRARRFRRLGDIWEWVGRQDNDPQAFAEALRAYETALELDPTGADVDSLRLRRARQRASDDGRGNKEDPRR